MFKWIASLFLTPEPVRPYVIYMRGHEIARSVSKKDAEEWILESFEETDNTRVGGRGFGTDCNTSKSYRRKQFRGACKITKLCTTCGRKEGYCGQC
jgi:hypothetical protein